MRLGALLDLKHGVESEFAKIKQLDIPTCQICCFDLSVLTDEMAQRILHASEASGIEISAFWCGWEGPQVWDFYEGPNTLGLVPPAYRYQRMLGLLRGADFAKQLNVSNLATHVGFIPENPNDPDYRSLIPALTYIVDYCGRNSIRFLFETGQESPVTLLRMIEDIGLSNIGINFDPANLIMYGKANPVDALDVFGKYVKGIHAKDGIYPVSGRALGQEVPMGQGKVNYPLLISRLKELGYDEPITIEREITGEQQINDIISAKRILQKLI